MSVADKPSEYLKRTCLICGCNTNQTINIYEPRSGPNIVELIQAKFKFQPLNEDKYLCFSCNNWLINWHSLQANNSNDAESPSGTFRSSQVNGGMANEKRAAPSQPETSSKQQNICRPVAHVKPRQLMVSPISPTATTTENLIEMEIPNTMQQSTEAQTVKISTSSTSTPPKPHSKQFYAKRCKRFTFRLRRTGMKQLNSCCVCGRPIVVCFRSTTGPKSKPKPKRTIKCRKCRLVCQWRNHLTKDHINHPLISTSPASLVNQLQKSAPPPPPPTTTTATILVDVPHTQNQCLERPLVDGKVVAMLRRLGTTLSRESSQPPTNKQQQQQSSLPPIMSPAKPKPRWTRPLEADEILLNFETAISEVLPFVERVKMLNTKPTNRPALVRRKLTYQMSTIGGDNVENLLSSLPKALNVSLV